MKRLLLVLFLIPTIVFSQIDSSFEFKVIDSAKATKVELYNYSKIWLANYFNSAQSIIQFDDKESGVIIAKGLIHYEDKGNIDDMIYNIKFSIEISLKDNKYRIRLYDYIMGGTIYDHGVVSPGTTTINGSGLLFSDDKFRKLPYSKELIPRVEISSKGILKSFADSIKKQTVKDDF